MSESTLIEVRNKRTIDRLKRRLDELMNRINWTNDDHFGEWLIKDETFCILFILIYSNQMIAVRSYTVGYIARAIN